MDSLNDLFKFSTFDIPLIKEVPDKYRKSHKRTQLQVQRKLVNELICKTLDLAFPLEIGHMSNGAPYIKSLPMLNLSISHCTSAVAILISQKFSCIGVDVENMNERAYNVKDKFMTAHELRLMEQAFKEEYNEVFLSERLLYPTEQNIATAFWSCKESIFKAYSHIFPDLTLMDIECRLELIPRSGVKEGSSITLPFAIKLPDHEIDTSATFIAMHNSVFLSWVLV